MPWNWVPAGLSLALATLLLMVGRLPEPGVSGSGVPTPPPIGSGLPEPPTQDRNELAQVEADLDELEALASEPEWDLPENVAGGEL